MSFLAEDLLKPGPFTVVGRLRMQELFPRNAGKGGIWRVRQEDCGEFEASPDDIARFYLK